MTSQIFSLFAAAAVAAAGVGATGETRSAQSLPVAHAANRLADANGNGTDEGHCVREKKLVDALHPRCAIKGGGAFGTPLAFGLGGAAIAGVVIAADSGHHNPISH